LLNHSIASDPERPAACNPNRMRTLKPAIPKPAPETLTAVAADEAANVPVSWVIFETIAPGA
jgi:hypothetical protein